MKDEFIAAIWAKQTVRLHFYSKEDGGVLARKCAPMDYGPSRRATEKNNRYHLWDYESDTRVHTLSLNPDQIQSIEVLNEEFDPSSFVTWDLVKSPWFVSRDWGNYS